jgi:hypothetical protein
MSHRTTHFGLPLVIALATLTTSPARADDARCAHCGRCAACQKVCRLVHEEKKVDVACWGCKREDFCVPGPSRPGCRHCEEVCAPCDAACNPQGVGAKPKTFSWTEWIPGCSAQVYTRTKLMRKIVPRKVPSYKWVVEDLCEACEGNCGCADVPPGAEIPPPPAVNAKLKYGVQPLD